MEKKWILAYFGSGLPSHSKPVGHDVEVLVVQRNGKQLFPDTLLESGSDIETWMTIAAFVTTNSLLTATRAQQPERKSKPIKPVSGGCAGADFKFD